MKKPYFYFCDLPSAAESLRDGWAVVSAALYNEADVASGNYARNPLLFSAAVNAKLNITNPNRLAMRFLCQRLAYSTNMLDASSFNTFIRTEDRDDYGVTLNLLKTKGIHEEVFQDVPEIYARLNIDFASVPMLENLASFFDYAKLCRSETLKMLKGCKTPNWPWIMRHFYKSTAGEVKGYGLKVYPNW